MICKRQPLYPFGAALLLLLGHLLGASCFGGQAPLLPSERIVLQTGFEHDNPSVDISDFKLVDDVAFDGHHSLMGQIEGPRKACFLMIPYAAKKGRQVNVSFSVRSDNRSACAVFWTRNNGKTKTSLARIPNVSVRRWTQVKCSHAFEADEKGFIQIVARKRLHSDRSSVVFQCACGPSLDR
ncbi:MAG: hypothetical protein ACYTE3_23870 [Planctomycetota bacterium]